jgi:hypothetical protein
MQRAPLTAILATAAATAVFLAGCARDTMLLESDIPLPHGMSTVRSADIRRTAGTVSGGTFLLSGAIQSADDAMKRTADRFLASGWTIVHADGDSDGAQGVFVKDQRTVELDLRRRLIEPRMSSGWMIVRAAAATPRQ